MNWLKKIFGSKEDAEVALAGKGALFGLDPPEGCQFDVRFSGGRYWHVQIVRGGWPMAHSCVCEEDNVNEKATILLAAKRALDGYRRTLVVETLVGLYPPKRTP